MTSLFEGARFGGGSGLNARRSFPIASLVRIYLDKEVLAEIEEASSEFSSCGVICRFMGLWPSLPDLNQWTSTHWEPLILGTVHIFPMAKGFFVAKFENVEYRNLILCNSYFTWENHFMLVVKPWSLNFSPTSESFDKIPILVRLPYLPLHLWVDTLLEVVGKALGIFLMVDELSDDMMQSIYACILVEMDISKGLQEMIRFEHSGGSWIQTLDYEGIPYRCRKCFKTSHLVA